MAEQETPQEGESMSQEEIPEIAQAEFDDLMREVFTTRPEYADLQWFPTHLVLEETAATPAMRWLFAYGQQYTYTPEAMRGSDFPACVRAVIPLPAALAVEIPEDVLRLALALLCGVASGRGLAMAPVLGIQACAVCLALAQDTATVHAGQPQGDSVMTLAQAVHLYVGMLPQLLEWADPPPETL